MINKEEIEALELMIIFGEERGCSVKSSQLAKNAIYKLRNATSKVPEKELTQFHSKQGRYELSRLTCNECGRKYLGYDYSKKIIED